MGNDFLCEQCDSEYQILHREKDNPSFCPFCGWQKIEEDEDIDDERDWDYDDV